VLWHNAAMPLVPEASLAEAVAEASAQMHDPNYISTRVDRFIAAQPAIAKHVMAQAARLTVEGIVSVLFHAQVLSDGVTRACGPRARAVPLATLQQAAGTTLEALAEDEPHLASYIASNVTDQPGARFSSATARSLLAQVARALVLG